MLTLMLPDLGFLGPLKAFFDWLGSILSILFPIFGIFTVVFMILIMFLFPLLDSFKGSLEEAGVEILKV